MKIILDTHILLWSLLNPSKIREQTKVKISEARTHNLLFISSISLWEIAMLSSKNRITLHKSLNNFLKDIEKISNLNIVSISAGIASESVGLHGFQGDPADRIIVATAKELGATLITRDEQILEYSANENLLVDRG